METPANQIICDGCGRPASSEHIAERVARLELATRYRPIHIGVLFIAAAPSPGLENDFYCPPKSRKFFDAFMEAVEIPVSAKKSPAGGESDDLDVGRLVEFQRRGYYLTYLSECPYLDSADTTNETMRRLGETLARRVRHNYRPKHIAILGHELRQLRTVLETSGVAAATLSNLKIPQPGDMEGQTSFRSAFASLAHGASGSD
jgi:hypothetical protein